MLFNIIASKIYIFDELKSRNIQISHLKVIYAECFVTFNFTPIIFPDAPDYNVNLNLLQQQKLPNLNAPGFQWQINSIKHLQNISSNMPLFIANGTSTNTSTDTVNQSKSTLSSLNNCDILLTSILLY